MGFIERGTSWPFSSATVNVINDRSFPSPAIAARSGARRSLAGGPAVFTRFSAHGLLSLQATTRSSPGSYLTSSQRRRYSDGALVLRPSDAPLRNSSASSPEE